MDLGLVGKTCVVTGASRGIGLATAKLLCAEGADVLLVARDSGRLAHAISACTNFPGRAERLALDVTDPAAAERIGEFCDKRLGRIAVLVNNAGMSAFRPLEELTEADWQTQWEVNVLAPMRLMRAFGPAMAERGWGRIVNVCSSAGKRPSLTNMAYSVTKAAQLSLSRAFADTYAAAGVLVNAVAPGAVATDLWLEAGGLADQIAAGRAISREEALEAQRDRLPLGRFAEPEEVATVITFLCSELASDVAGAAWSVDGGAVPVII